jgi:hypothetical protein
MAKHLPTDPIPDHLRQQKVYICRADLPDDHPLKVHPVFGYRIEEIQKGIDPYPIEWWAE